MLCQLSCRVPFFPISSIQPQIFYAIGLLDNHVFRESKVMMTRRILILVLLTAIGTWTVNWGSMSEIIHVLRATPAGAAYVILCQFTFMLAVTVFLWRLFLVLRYRAVAPQENDKLPFCTVLIPAYNEGRMVLRTLRSVRQSDYPREKLQIIAIDDGSSDDTWHWIEQAAAEAAGTIETVRLAQNQGKRKALHEGIMRSKGDVLVTIDSDSIIEPQTLRCMTSPFAVDAHVGAVAGCVRVLNKKDAAVPKMLEIIFAYSFNFFRASQSEVNTVFCTPGALSAYRKDGVMKVLDAWLNQSFFGKPAKIGEDRAMTNALLREGYHVTFQSNAVVHTNVPIRYRSLCKMLLRWARSNVRESLAMGCFIFRNFRDTPATGARINFMLSVLQLVLPSLMLAGAIACIVWKPQYFFVRMLDCAAITGLIPAAFYFIRYRTITAFWAVPYSMFWILALSWIPVYAILTVGNNGWLTRQKNARRTFYPLLRYAPVLFAFRAARSWRRLARTAS